MTQQTAEPVFFRFEADFIEANIRCIPMIVRFKLDACGIKLKLAEWSRMTPEERNHLAIADCETPLDVVRYRENLLGIILRRTRNRGTSIPVPQDPAWSRTDEIPYTVNEKIRESSTTLSLQQWQNLTDLQRFALLKLSYPGHENKNFPRAMEEFGLGLSGEDRPAY
jgi:hypothetical protein